MVLDLAAQVESGGDWIRDIFDASWPLPRTAAAVMSGPKDTPLLFGGHYEAVFLDRKASASTRCNPEWILNPSGPGYIPTTSVHRSMCSCSNIKSGKGSFRSLADASGALPSLTTQSFLLNDLWVLMTESYRDWSKTPARPQAQLNFTS